MCDATSRVLLKEGSIQNKFELDLKTTKSSIMTSHFKLMIFMFSSEPLAAINYSLLIREESVCFSLELSEVLRLTFYLS